MYSYIVDSDILSTIVDSLKTREEVMDFAEANGLMDDIRVKNRLAQLESDVSNLDLCLLFIDCVTFCLFHTTIAQYDSIS